MRYFKGLTSGLIAALLLAACGGGGDGNQSPKVKFTAMVNFGDSLSDVGTYKVGTVAALGGGKWTVNSASAKNWTEVLAAQLSLSTPCPAVTGLNGTANAGFNVPPVANTACKNYAQGGSRVSNVFGPGNAAYDALTNTVPSVGALTYPVTTQITNHLATVNGSFSGTELVTVMAGANDLFIQFSVFNVLQSVNPNQQATIDNFRSYAATFAGWSNDDVNSVLGAGANATTAAATVMVTKMGATGLELANLIKSQIVAKGAKYTLVLNMPNVSRTPFATALNNPTLTGVLASMTSAFNASLQTGLTGTAGVKFGDAYVTNTDQFINPSQYGITNVTTPACGTTSSLICSTATTGALDYSTYLFADGVHPTPYGYKLIAQEAAKHLVIAGWL